MSRIEELIREKCPDGVKYRSVGEVCDTCTDYTAAGSFADIAKNVQYRDVPDYALLVRTMDVKSQFTKGNLVYIDKQAYDYLWRVQLDEPCIIMPNIGNCGEVYYVVPSDLPYDKCALAPNAILLRSSGENLKYISYIFQTPEFQKQLKKITSPAGQTKFNKTEMKKLEIPVPPIEIQQEIVRILDKFTELEAELQAELDSRKKQYEHYRDELFVTEVFNGAEYIKLEKLCSIITKQTGFDYSATIKSALVKEASQNVYSFIQNKDFNGSRINLNTDYYIPITVAERYPKITIDTPSLLVSLSGKVGNVGFYGLDVRAFIGGAVGICKLKEGIVGKYIMYYLMSAKGQKYLFKSVKAASHINLTVESIRETPIPVTSSEIQQEIVCILDAFRELEEELQAELNARKQQYEYYRDKLLAFKRKEV